MLVKKRDVRRSKTQNLCFSPGNKEEEEVEWKRRRRRKKKEDTVELGALC